MILVWPHCAHGYCHLHCGKQLHATRQRLLLLLLLRLFFYVSSICLLCRRGTVLPQVVAVVLPHLADTIYVKPSSSSLALRAKTCVKVAAKRKDRPSWSQPQPQFQPIGSPPLPSTHSRRQMQQHCLFKCVCGSNGRKKKYSSKHSGPNYELFT